MGADIDDELLGLAVEINDAKTRLNSLMGRWSALLDQRLPSDFVQPSNTEEYEDEDAPEAGESGTPSITTLAIKFFQTRQGVPYQVAEVAKAIGKTPESVATALKRMVPKYLDKRGRGQYVMPEVTAKK